MRNVYLWIPYSVILLVGLTACAFLGPIRTAETLEQKVYAVYGTFVIMEERAADLTTEGSGLTPDMQFQIIQAVQRAQGPVDSMLDAFRSYETARAEFELQAETEPRFQVAVDNLSQWVSDAEQVVGNLVLSMQGVRP